MVGAKADEFYDAFNNSHLRDDLCQQNNVIGYVVDSSVEELDKLEKEEINEEVDEAAVT